MIGSRFAVLAIVTLVTAVPSVQASILFQDSFNGTGGPLNGSVPDITIGGETWEAGASWLDNGVAGTPVASGANGQAAHLDFVPESGKIYTAQATILNTQPNWVGFGFLPANPAGGDWTVQDFSVRHSNAPGYAWILTRNSGGNDQEGFLGGGTAGGRPWNGDRANPANPIDFQIVLNTMDPNWTVEWFINGVSQATPVAYAGLGNPGIGGIGFSHDRSASANNGAIISDFSLSVVPEPSSALLVGSALAGVAGVALRRRRS